MEARKALVSGGSSGIGQGTAIVLAEKGWDVAITYNTHPDGAKETRERVEALGRKCCILEAHLEEEGAPERMVREAARQLGGLDAFACNAARDARSSILTLTRKEIQRMVDTNLTGYLLAAGEAARYMVRTGTRGSIVFTTSTRWESAHPDDCLYGGLKAAIERASRSIALDLAPYKIRVNCVAPGATQVRPWQARVPSGTIVDGRPVYPLEDVIPLDRMGLPRDVGNAVAFLFSDESSYITGTTIRVDGGLVLPGMPEGYASCQWISPKWIEKQREGMEDIP